MCSPISKVVTCSDASNVPESKLDCQEHDLSPGETLLIPESFIYGSLSYLDVSFDLRIRIPSSSSSLRNFLDCDTQFWQPSFQNDNHHRQRRQINFDDSVLIKSQKGIGNKLSSFDKSIPICDADDTCQGLGGIGVISISSCSCDSDDRFFFIFCFKT